MSLFNEFINFRRLYSSSISPADATSYIKLKLICVTYHYRVKFVAEILKNLVKLRYALVCPILVHFWGFHLSHIMEGFGCHFAQIDIFNV